MNQPQWRRVWDITAVLLVFSITGTLASFLPAYLLPALGVHSGWSYGLAYFFIITPIYLALLFVVAFLFGKFDYFYRKQSLLFRRIKALLRRNKNRPVS